MDLDREFHMGISRAAKNRLLAELLLQLHERSLRFWFISLNDPHHLHQVRREHGEVLHAIAERDSEAAAATIRAHIESFRNTITVAI
jgi:DNA-binding FadR family transcriptional regulator